MADLKIMPVDTLIYTILRTYYSLLDTNKYLYNQISQIRFGI